MDQKTRELVRTRAGGICEYCRVPQRFFSESFHVEHVIAKQHRGTSEEGNLALACHHCNLHKGPNIAGRDPNTDELTRLFNPRTDVWDEHFKILQNGSITGLTEIGRTTLELLDFNTPLRTQLRIELATIAQLNGE